VEGGVVHLGVERVVDAAHHLALGPVDRVDLRQPEDEVVLVFSISLM
jgi:hypothetical protein